MAKKKDEDDGGRHYSKRGASGSARSYQQFEEEHFAVAAADREGPAEQHLADGDQPTDEEEVCVLGGWVPA